MPVGDTKFCLVETTHGAVRIGRIIEFETCGNNITIQTDLYYKEEYNYGVDKSPKEIIIEPSVYQNWFTDPSDNCTIEEYQMVVPKNPRDEAEGNIDIYDPKDFTDPGIYTDIVYLEDEVIIIDKEADMLYIPV